MNTEKLDRLIEATKVFEGFDMEDHSTCVCAVGRWIAEGERNPYGEEGFWDSSILSHWLEVKSQFNHYWDDPVRNLVVAGGYTREQAIKGLEALRGLD